MAQFWKSYAQEAVYFAKIAEAEGVELFSLGTETERLFRTRSDGRWPNHFRAELSSMVSEIRQVYTGSLTYDMHYHALTASDFYSGSDHLWEDLGLDVVGISAWFGLMQEPAQSTPSVASLETIWDEIFQTYLLPLKAANPDRPILLLEFGYKDSLAATTKQGNKGKDERIFQDQDGNGLDDGAETQENIYQAFFNTMNKYPNIVQGAFLWGNQMASDSEWSESRGHLLRGKSIRNKLVEEVVRATYESWIE